MNWYKFMEKDIKDEFNNKLTNALNDCVSLSYNKLCNYMNKAAKEAVNEKAKEDENWFTHSKDLLKPLIKERNDLLHQAKIKQGEDNALK